MDVHEMTRLIDQIITRCVFNAEDWQI